MVILSGVRCK